MKKTNGNHQFVRVGWLVALPKFDKWATYPHRQLPRKKQELKKALFKGKQWSISPEEALFLGVRKGRLVD